MDNLTIPTSVVQAKREISQALADVPANQQHKQRSLLWLGRTIRHLTRHDGNVDAECSQCATRVRRRPSLLPCRCHNCDGGSLEVVS